MERASRFGTPIDSLPDPDVDADADLDVVASTPVTQASAARSRALENLQPGLAFASSQLLLSGHLQKNWRECSYCSTFFENFFFS